VIRKKMQIEAPWRQRAKALNDAVTVAGVASPLEEIGDIVGMPKASQSTAVLEWSRRFSLPREFFKTQRIC
jgi:hypothetical protein